VGRLFVLLGLPLVAMATVHYAKVEPCDEVVIKSAVSALVTEVDVGLEGHLLSGERVVHLDDTLDILELNNTKRAIVLLEKMYGINQEVASSLDETLKRKESYYHRLNPLRTASKTQKDNAYNTFIATKTQYLATQEKLVSLEKQIMDMRYKRARLEERIRKKSLQVDQRYLSKLMVRVGDFVNPGSPLAKVADLRRAKLVVFLSPDEVEGLATKRLFLDDKASGYRIDKVWRVADEKFISSYRAEISIDSPKGLLSKLVKVELK